VSEKYTAEQIKAVSGIEHVRLRPAMYIGDVSERGLHHLIWEILDNAVDEAMAGYANKIKVELLSENIVSIEDNGRGIPVDIHPQLKKPALEIIFTHLGAGGKFSKEAYKYSGGLHGVGATVVNALSKFTEVIVRRDGKEFKQVYEKGVAKSPLTFLRVVSEKNTGTKVTFEPDNEIFEISRFDPSKIEKRLKELAFLNPGVKFIFKDHVHNKEKEFFYKDGIKALIKELCPKEKSLFFDPIYLKVEEKGVILEIAFSYNDSYNEITESFVNNIKTPGHGTHVFAFKSALVKSVNKVLSSMKVEKEMKEGFTYDDLKEGLISVVSAKVPEPQFEGQTKDKLGNSEVKKMDKLIFEELIKIFQKKKDIIKKIAEKALETKRAREAAKRAKQLVRRKSFLDNLNLPGKLTDCIEKDNTKTELFIVEGDSAGGTAKQARNKKFQAVLPLRGKILNVEKSSLNKILNNEEVKTLIQAIGTGIKENFNYENRRYGKIIIMTDADVDGSHIRALLLTLFYNLMRPLIEKGHVFIALPPLYRLKKGKEVIYVLDDKELEKIKKKILNEKGLSNFLISQIFEFEELVKSLKISQESIDIIINSRNLEELKENLRKKEIGFKEYSDHIEIEGEIFNKEDLFNGFIFERLRNLYNDIKKQLPIVIKEGDKEIKLNNIFSLARDLSKIALSDYEIQRYKGLGEMNADQLWETTMNPKTRKIKQVKIEDAIEADEMIKALMGEDTKKRKEIIFEEAYKANLDV